MEKYTALFAELSPLGVLAGAVVIVLVGTIWYSNFLFGKAWMRHSGIRSTDITARDAKRGYFLGSLVALVQSALVALIVLHTGGSWYGFTACIGVLWLFILLEEFNRFIWERDTFALVLIQAFRSLATLMAAAFTYHFVS